MLKLENTKSESPKGEDVKFIKKVAPAKDKAEAAKELAQKSSTDAQPKKISLGCIPTGVD